MKKMNRTDSRARLSLGTAETESVKAGTIVTKVATSPEGNQYTYEQEAYSIIDRIMLTIFA